MEIDNRPTGLEKSFLCQSQNFSGQARESFFWSHFLSTWSLSCAKTQKFRRKKKAAIFKASFCTHPNTNIINEMIARCFFFFSLQWKSMESKKSNYYKEVVPNHSLESRRGRGRRCRVKADKTFASRAKRKRKENAPACVNRLYHGRFK